MVTKSALNEIAPFKTKDGSTIREMMHPRVHGNVNQSLAQAVVAVAERTICHYHKVTEELYYVQQGDGVITLDRVKHEISAGDTVLIGPGVIHCVENSGETDLKILCCCAPAYSHDDTYCTE
jgi:mannose-6-phosphate isomerase-like protein (cupin superfamily)|tara:strand:- start:2998 stop:3363 length:366 start_codon:yes stop_codon:yes gene_type:complete